MERSKYTTDLIDKQWGMISPLLMIIPSAYPNNHLSGNPYRN